MCQNGLCNFASMEEGEAAHKRVVRGYIEREHSIESMSEKYTETEQESWARCVSTLTKIPLSTKLNSL